MANDTKTPTGGLLSSLGAAVGFGPEAQREALVDKRTPDNATQDYFLKVFDFDILAGRIDTISNLIADNIIATEAILKPALLFNNLANPTLSFQRTSVAPQAMSFSSTGLIVADGVSVSSVDVSFTGGNTALAATAVIGFVLQIRALSNQTGNVQGNIAFTTAGTSFNYALADVNRAGYAFIWSHLASTKATATAVLSGAAGAVTNVLSLTSTTITDDFQVSIGGQEMTVTGNNAIISLYPVYMTDDVSESLLAYITADNVPAYGAAVIADFQSRGSL